MTRQAEQYFRPNTLDSIHARCCFWWRSNNGKAAAKQHSNARQVWFARIILKTRSRIVFQYYICTGQWLIKVWPNMMSSVCSFLDMHVLYWTGLIPTCFLERSNATTSHIINTLFWRHSKLHSWGFCVLHTISRMSRVAALILAFAASSALVAHAQTVYSPAVPAPYEDSYPQYKKVPIVRCPSDKGMCWPSIMILIIMVKFGMIQRHA